LESDSLAAFGGAAVALFQWLSGAQMRQTKYFFSLGGYACGYRRMISGIIFVIRNGLPWRDAADEDGPPKTIWNRFISLSRLGCSTASLPNWHETAAGRIR
jgi:transposase